ncbi:ABC-2 type transport system ATP-binding protein [Allocatelliglobosispora scoriae]|uniref:ABC-2 type transport system ATP-binding protein n=1 Tax=Allocatelliglobosispora scoriae TaxID=643052 RepID=A0A841BLJ3_9ACTN|nr:ABC transporter ATP-binding protein [Allocatelliglobosispora scoriae]MBB5868069.1 ABC-2 type transport system ATP-binding protein [Allocatelliglobosispora scoriae]
MPGTDTAISAISLTKRYPDVTAVDAVDLQVRAGEIYALLGLNGAGKTTLIRMLLGMVRPTTGSLTVLGRPVGTGRGGPWADVGYLVETPAAYPELTVAENLHLVRRLRHQPHNTVGEVIERLALTPYAHRRARTLSLGNAQRLGLAKALLHHPRLLILDEPSNGLDPAGVAEIRALLHDLATQHGVTVFLSSHILTEVARLATRIGVIHQGTLRQELDTDQLPHHLHRRLLVATRDNPTAAAVLHTAGYRTEPHDGALTTTDPAAVDRPDDIATLLVRAGCPPTRLTVETEDLETYFLRLVAPDRNQP